MSWHRLASCSGLGQAVFYGYKETGGGMSPPEVRRAKAVCVGCPAKRSCLEFGLDEEWGVWGGLTKPERDRAKQTLGSRQAILDAYDDGTLPEVVSLNG